MAQVCRHRRAVAASLSALATLIFASAFAQDQGPKNRTDLYDRPVLAVDPGMHTARIETLAVDAGGRFAITGSDDRTARIWSVADGSCCARSGYRSGLRTWAPCTLWRSAPMDRRSQPGDGPRCATANIQFTYS